MLREALLFVAALLIILILFILIEPSILGIRILQPTPCPPTPGLISSQTILRDMMRQSNPPTSQPVYTMFRAVPKDVVTHSEHRYLKEAIQWFSKGSLELLDIEHVDWMAKDESSPIVGLLDARVKVAHQSDVIRILMMWCERDLWSVKLANGKGCFLPTNVRQCKPLVGSVANKPIQMPAYKVMKSVIGRKQTFEWDNTGVLVTDTVTKDTPMINTAYQTRPPELYQNPTMPTKLKKHPMFLKVFGVPRS